MTRLGGEERDETNFPKAGAKLSTQRLDDHRAGVVTRPRVSLAGIAEPGDEPGAGVPHCGR